MRTFLLLLALILLVPASAGAAPPAPSPDGLDSVPMTGLRDAMRRWDGLAQAWFRLAAGDADGARGEARRLLRERPRDPDALHLLGIAAAAAGKPLQAEGALRRSLRLRPDGWVGVQLVNLYLDGGKIKKADKVVGDLERTLAADVEVRRARIYVLLASDRLDEAKDALVALESARPSAPSAHQLAILLSELGDPVGALAASRRAVERDPDSALYRRELFDRLVDAGDWDGLVAASSAAGASSAGGGRDAWYRGLALARLGRPEEAVKAFASVVQHGSPDPRALTAAAGHLLQLGSYTHAEEAVRAAMRLSDSDSALHHLLAMTLSRQARESEGLAHYRRAAEAVPADATYRFDLLVSMCALERTGELGDALTRARRDFPEDARFGALADRCLADAPSS
ncbi:MAG: tetratricopeptide repeat protein [Proteobacteria bacterium]|nr:tetratricopeptide repeat protein [Pseudomonadota bacterium]